MTVQLCWWRVKAHTRYLQPFPNAFRILLAIQKKSVLKIDTVYLLLSSTRPLESKGCCQFAGEARSTVAFNGA